LKQGDNLTVLAAEQMEAMQIRTGRSRPEML